MRHGEFRLELTWELIQLAIDKDAGKEDQRKTRNSQTQLDIPPSKPNVTKTSYNLDPSRLLPGHHLPGHQEKREACLWCRHRAKLGLIEINQQNPPQSNTFCQSCNAVLCFNNQRNCFAEYHTVRL